MYLYISVDAQYCTGSDFVEILSDTIRKLNFITSKDKDLENNNDYGTEFKSIELIPACMSKEFRKNFGWKMQKQILRKKQSAKISLNMDYEQFIIETFENKRLMFIDIIIKSLQIVQNKSISDFKGKKLINDILYALQVNQDQLSKLEDF